MNESQALLVCLFSRTERAAEDRESVITVFTLWRRAQRVVKPRQLTGVQVKAINSQAWALARAATRSSYERHKTRLVQEARELLAAGRPIDALLENRKDPE